jgi:hypothetical protein
MQAADAALRSGGCWPFDSALANLGRGIERVTM